MSSNISTNDNNNIIITKEKLNQVVTRIRVKSPLVAKKAEAGQFVILRTCENGERIPLTISDVDQTVGSVTLVFQTLGRTTQELSLLNIGDAIHDFVGPLGRPTDTEGFQRVAVIGGGVGCAIAYPTAKKFRRLGATVHSIVGFRNKELVILEDEFRSVSNVCRLMTDDGSYGEKGMVTDALKTLLEEGNGYDAVLAFGPLIMMKFVAKLTKAYGIKTIVSMNPVMVDGTGMCGCCRLTVAGQTRFACVDGPDFDGHQVDFDEVLERNSMYREFEQRESGCNLLAQEVK